MPLTTERNVQSLWLVHLGKDEAKVGMGWLEDFVQIKRTFVFISNKLPPNMSSFVFTGSIFLTSDYSVATLLVKY